MTATADQGWKYPPLFRLDPQVRYGHIQLVFTKHVEPNLIETTLTRMLPVPNFDALRADCNGTDANAQFESDLEHLSVSS